MRMGSLFLSWWVGPLWVPRCYRGEMVPLVLGVAQAWVTGRSVDEHVPWGAPHQPARPLCAVAIEEPQGFISYLPKESFRSKTGRIQVASGPPLFTGRGCLLAAAFKGPSGSVNPQEKSSPHSFLTYHNTRGRGQ